MRFGLKSLAMLVVVFFFNLYAWSAYQEFGVFVTHYWQRARIEIRNLEVSIHNIKNWSDEEVSCSSINEWLEGTLSKEHFLAGMGCPDKDPWGNPYRCVSIADDQGNLQHLTYCLGRDGISNSEGNDPDDLNSWDVDNSGQWYEEKLKRSKRIKSVIWAMISTPIIWFFSFLFLNRKGNKGDAAH